MSLCLQSIRGNGHQRQQTRVTALASASYAHTRIILAAAATYGSLASFRAAMNGANGSNLCQLPRLFFAFGEEKQSR